jgi:cytochrome c-type biogenesis protein CcmH
VISALAALVAALVFAGPALAQECASLADLEDELVCPTCNTTLELSRAPVADRMRAYVRERVEACATKDEIKAELVAQFGEEVLAAPPKRGFNWLAWAFPLAGLALAGAVVTLLARRWLRGRAEAAPLAASSRVDPELERRLDDELARFDA